MKIQFHLKSYHVYYLNQFIIKIQNELHKKKEYLTKTQGFLPLKIERYTLLRSPHVDKKSREQFERTTYKRVLIFTSKYDLNEKVREELLQIVQSSAIGIEVTIKYRKNGTYPIY